MKDLIQRGFQNSIQMYKNQSKKGQLNCSNASATHDKLETGKLEPSRKNQESRQGQEKYCKEDGQYSRCLSLRIKNMKKQDNESSDKDLEAAKCLFSEVSINTPDACIDCA